jgi:hypothetical protein
VRAAELRVLRPPRAQTVIRLTSATFAFRAGMVLFLVINAALPSLRAAKEVGDSLLWACLMAFALTRSIAGATAFTASTVILNGLLADHQGIGLFNGVNDSLSALGRSLAPTAMGSLFAAMTQPPVGGWPWDEHLPFYFVSALCVVAVLISTRFKYRVSL